MDPDAPRAWLPVERRGRVEPDEIRGWYETLKAGGSVSFYSDANPYERALCMATVRALNGLGVDRTDPNGEQAMAEVRAALGQDQPAPGRR